MLRFLLSLYEFRQRKPLNVYQVHYSPLDGDFFLTCFIEARSVYEACREFDTNPLFDRCRRRGTPTIS